MPQELNVLRCYSCKVYQVQIVKKARRWQCALCNEKQSVQQIYFQGSGKDCRLYVQRSNLSEANGTSSTAMFYKQNDAGYNYNTCNNISQGSDNDRIVENKWAKYLDSPTKRIERADVSSKDIYDAEDLVQHHNKPDDMGNDCPNFEEMINNSDVETNVSDKRVKEELRSTSYEPSLDTKCTLQDNSKDFTTSIFETYSELDDPLNF